MPKEGAIIVDTSKISGFLRQTRLQNNLTQLNVAEKLGITPQAVSKWERSESMPDITLLPEIAEIYSITIEDIITAGASGGEANIAEIMQTLNSFIDDRIFNRVQQEFEKAKCVQELSVPMDFFMALNTRQKDILLELLLKMDGYEAVIDDILPNLNMSQRAKLIMRVAENCDYDTLETLIPFMTRLVRTEIAILMLKRKNYGFLEEMMMFLNHEQKEMILCYFVENGLDFEILDGLMPFFEKTLNKYQNRRNLNE